MNSSRIHPLLNPMITLAVLFGVGYLLVLEKIIFVPVVLAFMFSFLLLPGTSRLEKRGVPRIAANLIMIIISILLVVSIGILMSFALSQFVGDLPAYRDTVNANIANIQEFVARIAHVSVADQRAWIADNLNILELGARNAGTLVTGATRVVSTLGLTFIYTFFFLYYRDKLRAFLQQLLGAQSEANILGVVNKFETIVPKYLTGVLTVALILGVFYTAGFFIIGLHNAILFGIMVAILNIIPYAGPIIGFGIVVLFALATQNPGVALGAIIVYLIAQFIDNNFLTPNIAGGGIDINPLAAIVSIIVGGVMWGVVGMIIALPIVAMIKVACDAVPHLRPWGYLLGNGGTEEYALTWDKAKHWFQRKK